MPSSTYTYTSYFSDDDPEIVKLRHAAAALDTDAASRRPYISEEAGDAMAARLSLLNAAIQLLVEPVPPSFGG